MKKKLIPTLCALLMSSCAFDSTRNGTFAHTSFRLGTDTEARTLEGPGVKTAIANENNSKSFGQVASIAKWAIVGAAAKSITNSVSNSITSTKNATTAADAATKQTLIKSSTGLQSEALKAGATTIPAVPALPPVP